MRNYLGLSCSFHDPALAIVNSEGEVVFAEAAERHLQNKRAFNSPPDDIGRTRRLVEAYCRDEADLVVAHSWRSARLRQIRSLLAPVDFLTTVYDRLRGRDGSLRSWAPPLRGLGMEFEHILWVFTSLVNSTSQASANLRERRWLDNLGYASPPPGACMAQPGRSGAGTQSLPAMGLAGRDVFSVEFEHHLTHAAAACFASPFRDAACAIIDAWGEHGATAFYRYGAGKLTKIKTGRSSTSVGQLYTAICYGCGFDALAGEEWKVMGLAPYGGLNSAVYERLRGLLRVKGLRFVRGRQRCSFGGLVRELRACDRAEVAFTGQKVFEELMAELLANLLRLGISENLVLGGGCALNSSNNGRILPRSGFKSLYVFSAPADDGNAIGAAWLAFQKDNPDWVPTPRVQDPFLGSAMCAETIDRLLAFGSVAMLSRLGPQIARKTAQLLAEGKIVAWIQGRAEFGPRALGNRSILADPRRADMKEIINARVKFREEFRPFAPSILHEYGPDYFEDYRESPYMERTLPFKESKRKEVPAVVHVDGTGRLQSLRRERNGQFYDLVAEFHKITGVPLVLNTSLNIMGKPIIHSVEDAMGLFYTTGLDALVIGDVLIEKSAGAE